MNKIRRRTLKFSAMALAAAMLFACETNSAEAGHGYGGFGLTIGTGNLHVGIGTPVVTTATRANYTAYRREYSNPRWYGHPNRTSYRWHDTSHWDYTPGRYVPHGNHCDYVPGYPVWHRDGHWDRHDRGHRGRHH